MFFIAGRTPIVDLDCMLHRNGLSKQSVLSI